MIIFNNALDAALQYVCSWDKKNFLTEVTLIRDVQISVGCIWKNIVSDGEYGADCGY